MEEMTAATHCARTFAVPALIAILLLPLGAASVAAQPLLQGTRATALAKGCVAIGDVCSAAANRAVGKGQSVQLVLLLGCQAELEQDHSEAAKARANDCFLAALQEAPALSAEELSVGQFKLKETPQGLLLKPDAFAEAVRSRLVSTGAVCGRIVHLYSRYNCITRRLYNLFAMP
jgi:hypothetical protein